MSGAGESEVYLMAANFFAALLLSLSGVYLGAIVVGTVNLGNDSPI
jgi:hypothetical protein